MPEDHVRHAPLIDQTSPPRPHAVRPRHAASLIVYRGESDEVSMLMGMRGAKHRFMPNRLVFPGGAVDRDRSDCVINRTVEIFGDQWSLLIIRDITLMNRRHFRELLTKSMEGIASNILADRLQRLVEQEIIVKSQDASHKQKAIYSLTEKGIELLPLLMEMVAWGHKNLPASRLRGLAQVLDEGGPKMRAEFMAELRETHLRKSSAQKKARRRHEICAQFCNAEASGRIRSGTG